MAGNNKAWLGMNSVKEISTSEHTHSSNDIISGILPLIRGGTGVTSISELKSLLGISTTSGKIQIVQYNGTGSNAYQSLSFDFTPVGLIMLITGKNPYIGPGTLIWGATNYYYILSGNTIDSTTVSYSENNTIVVGKKLNYSGNTYIHIAFA